MSLRPSQLRAGDQLLITVLGGQQRKATFLRRTPARGKGCPAVNYLRFPEYVGLYGPTDDGTRTMSDYNLSRQGQLAGGAA